jgi:hypothetical protein
MHQLFKTYDKSLCLYRGLNCRHPHSVYIASLRLTAIQSCLLVLCEPVVTVQSVVTKHWTLEHSLSLTKHIHTQHTHTHTHFISRLHPHLNKKKKKNRRKRKTCQNLSQLVFCQREKSQ